MLYFRMKGVVGILKWVSFGEDTPTIAQNGNAIVNNVGKGFLNSDITTNQPFF